MRPRPPPLPRCTVRPAPHGRPATPMAAPADAAPAVDPQFVDLAHALADAAAAVTTRYFRSPLAVDAKADASPVTVADREAEAAVRAVLAGAVPTHAVYGEEGGLTQPPGGGPAADYMWVVDPIDGTKSFITGKPLWGTLIALLHRGTPILGVIDQPVTRERWAGGAGLPTTLNGRPARVRGCPALGDAYLYATTPHMFAAGGVEDAWARVRDASKIPLYGCDCYAYGLLASGHADAVVEADLGPYDYLAIVPIVTGAGGRMTDWRGAPLRAGWSPEAGHSVAGLPREVVAAGDERVHADIVKRLAWG